MSVTTSPDPAAAKVSTSPAAVCATRFCRRVIARGENALATPRHIRRRFFGRVPRGGGRRASMAERFSRSCADKSSSERVGER